MNDGIVAQETLVSATQSCQDRQSEEKGHREVSSKIGRSHLLQTLTFHSISLAFRPQRV